MREEGRLPEVRLSSPDRRGTGSPPTSVLVPRTPRGLRDLASPLWTETWKPGWGWALEGHRVMPAVRVGCPMSPEQQSR